MCCGSDGSRLILVSHVSVPFGRFAGEDVARAAVGAADFAGMQYVEVHTRVLAPERGARLRTMQRQVFGRDFNAHFVGHVVSFGAGRQEFECVGIGPG